MRLDEFSAFPSVAELDAEERTRFLCLGFDMTITGVAIYETIQLTAALLMTVALEAPITREISLTAAITPEIDLDGELM